VRIKTFQVKGSWQIFPVSQTTEQKTTHEFRKINQFDSRLITAARCDILIILWGTSAWSWNEETWFKGLYQKPARKEDQK